MSANWKLTIGMLWNAWRHYPAERRALASFPTGPPVFVAGTHRSGTTWVAKMLSVPGLWHIHEPFNPNKGIWTESFLYARPSERRLDIDSFVDQLLRGEHRQLVNAIWTDHPLMPLRLLSQPVRRIMIKDPLACLLTPYLLEHFDFIPLVLFRHPCGFVSSVLRLGWPTSHFLRLLLSRNDLMTDHLEDVRPIIEEHSHQDGLAAAAVLHGALNTVLWNCCQQHGLTPYVFEDLCEDPLPAFEKIFAQLKLPYNDAVREHHTRLCFNPQQPVDDYNTHSVTRNSRAMADSWRQQLTAAEIAEVHRIWERFEIPLYGEGEGRSINMIVEPQKTALRD